jgi:hypothetical protein
MIALLLLATSAHCWLQLRFVSAELVEARRSTAAIAGASRFVVRGEHVTARRCPRRSLRANRLLGRQGPRRLPPRPDAAPARTRRPAPRARAPRLVRIRGAAPPALLGTAIGFILMLIPLSGLESFEIETLRGALAEMSGGMAVP